ncbi:hypothetical protein JDS96_29770, partial [Bacillus cereus group sp. N21]|nr:hypothetical protein [Bacillus cereus group sp. N21]
MSKIIFNEMQMKQLEKNENVVKVSERSITYRADFKVKAVKENQIGKGKKAYLSCVKDSTTREILAYHVS